MRRTLAPLILVTAACAGPGVAPVDSSTLSATVPPATTPVAAGSSTTSAPPASTTAFDTSTSTSSPPATIDAAPLCATAGEPQVVGSLSHPGLIETSGVALSRSQPGVLWAHNDSGSPAEMWALDSSGGLLGVVEVEAENIDWEDVAIGPGPDGTDWIYVADTGNLDRERSRVALYRFPEPPAADGSTLVEELRIRYPGGPEDVEALVVDPESGNSYLLTKSPRGVSTVYELAADAWGSEEAVSAFPVGEVDLGLLSLLTAADISPDGTVIALRTYDAVLLFPRSAGQSLVDALEGDRCFAPSGDETQGEAIALDADGYVTVGEGVGAPIYRVDR